VDNLTTNVSDKPLSAAQGVVLKGLIDSLATAVGNKLDASALTDAINVALAQAKESGEFDGAPGKPGADGNPGIVLSEIQPEPYEDGTHPAWLDPSGDESMQFVTQGDLAPISFNGVVNTTGASDSAEGARTGNVVEVTLALTSAESGSTLAAAQMPYKPVHQGRSFLANPNGQLCRIILRPTGALDIYPVTSGKTTYYGQITYITNDEVIT